MPLPNYKNGSIVNLMSSIEKGLGGHPLYNILPKLDPKKIKKYTNVVLMIIDGLGYEYILKYGKGTVFKKYLRGKITSVFPSTTATAMTSFTTGVAPQQHGITGWFMYLKELGVITIPIPFCARGSNVLLNRKINPKEIYNQKPIFDRIKMPSYAVLPAKIANSITSKIAFGTKNKKTKCYTLTDFFKQINNKIKNNNNKKFIHAYWPDFDSYSHKYGVGSKKTFSHFKQVNKGFEKLIKSLEKTNTLLIITADHGLIDSPKNKQIILNKHPALTKTLTLPLCGEPRAAYCYVHPSKTKQFEKYVKTKLRKICTLYKRQDLLEKNYYGLFKPNQKLFDRIGDYVLIMKENYILKDFVLGEKKRVNIGNHGGISPEEMYVPLILIDCNRRQKR